MFAYGHPAPPGITISLRSERTMRPPVSSLIFLVAATAAASTLNITNPIPITGSIVITTTVYNTSIPGNCFVQFNNCLPFTQTDIEFTGTNSSGDTVSAGSPDVSPVPPDPWLIATLDGITTAFASFAPVSEITLYGADAKTVVATALLQGTILYGSPSTSDEYYATITTTTDLIVPTAPLNTPEPRASAGVLLLLLYGYYVARRIRLN